MSQSYWDVFTPRERDVMRAFYELDGLTVDICARLGITYHTYKAHINSIYQKLGLSKPNGTRVNNAYQVVRLIKFIHAGGGA